MEIWLDGAHRTYPNWKMETRPIKAAAILKAIKEGTAKTARALKVNFTKCDGDEAVISHLITQLEAAGLIKAQSGEYVVTRGWVEIERLLDLNLTALINNLLTVSPVFGAPQLLSSPAEIFVLMPFDERFKPVFEDHITAVAKRLGRSVARADDFFTPDVIMNNIWSAICSSTVVVADCTGRNPNVFYEIGLAHTIGRPVILMTQDKDVPFNLSARRYIKYTFDPRGVRELEEELYKSISSVFRDQRDPALRVR